MFEAFLMGIAVAVVHPFVNFFVQRWLEALRRKAAFDRLNNDPCFYKGADIAYLYVEGKEEPILTNCVVSDVKPGEVIIRKENLRMTFTGREFEKLNPIWKR